jgi:transposase InsO family protein
MPPADPFIPTAPFQVVTSDYFHLEGKSYLLTVDRFSHWPDLREAQAHSSQSGAHGLIKASRELFATFGVPEELSSDGGPEYIAKDFEDFLKTWGIKHRQSSAYNSQSNGRAEVTVKAMKRLLRDNIDHHGKLNTDAVTRAM